jgi:predicted nucleic acid-binding protein
VKAGDRKDPREAGRQQGVQNIRTGRYVRCVAVAELLKGDPRWAKRLAVEVEQSRRDGATFDDEIALLRACLGRFLENYGGAFGSLPGLVIVRDQCEAIIKASTAKSRAEQGIKIDLVGAVLPMLERVGSLVREGVTRYVTDDAQRRALEAFLDAGFAQAFSRVAPAGVAAVSRELAGD